MHGRLIGDIKGIKTVMAVIRVVEGQLQIEAEDMQPNHRKHLEEEYRVFRTRWPNGTGEAFLKRLRDMVFARNGYVTVQLVSEFKGQPGIRPKPPGERANRRITDKTQKARRVRMTSTPEIEAVRKALRATLAREKASGLPVDDSWTNDLPSDPLPSEDGETSVTFVTRKPEKP